MDENVLTVLKNTELFVKLGDVSEERISWMERIQELTAGCSSGAHHIWNMNKSECFLKALPEKRLVKKGQKISSFQIKNKNYKIILDLILLAIFVVSLLK